ncbi:MAG: methyltransferase domain-containing protein [Polyangiaceae bacterium]|nr:methyltransferase domain-containing protein [Polyangiaceae bacterium]
MLLTLRVTGPEASDLEVLLDKCPDKLHTVKLPFGMAHVFFPEVSPDAVTAALVLDVDAVDGSPGGSRAGFAMANGAALSLAIAHVFRYALAARCPKRPDLVTSILPVVARVSSFTVRRGTDDVRAFFAPLGYDVACSEHALSEETDAVRHDAHLTKRCTLFEVLSHLFVLAPVLDASVGDRVLDGEIQTLFMHAEGALRGHPAAERIMHAYGSRRLSGPYAALARLWAADSNGAPTNVDTSDVASLLDDARIDAIVAQLRLASVHSVVDLACGDGKLLLRLVREKALTRIVGLDVSSRMLDAAAARMKLDRRAGKKSERLELLHGSLYYKDSRLRGFDAAVLVDMIQFVYPNRLADVEKVVFDDAQPSTVVVMMNAAGGDASSEARHDWSVDKFDAWARSVSSGRGYRLGLSRVGSANSGAAMAVFSR